MELVHGVVRRQATLDAMIAPCVSRPRDRVEPDLWTLLQGQSWPGMKAFFFFHVGIEVALGAAINETLVVNLHGPGG